MKPTPTSSNVFDRLAMTLTTPATRHPWLTLFLTLALVIATGSGLGRLGFSNNYRVFFSPQNPELIAFEAFQETYTKNDNILFVLRPSTPDVSTPDLVAAVEELTNSAWQIPYAIRVDSVTNFQHSRAEGDDLTVEDLIRDAASQDPETLEERLETALEEPLLNGSLVSPDARTMGVNVTLQYPEETEEEVPHAAAFARSLAQDVEQRHPGLRVAISGVSMLNNAFGEAGMQDAMTLVPFMYLVLVLLALLTLRSAIGAVATLLIIGFSTATSLGIGAWYGIDLAPISATAPTVILTLAIADCIHILITLLTSMRKGLDQASALRESLRLNFQAVFLTSLTTVVGFLSLNFSDAPPFKDLGNLTAMGIGAAFFYTITFLPALLSIVRIKVRPLELRDQSGQTLTSRAFHRLGEFVIRRDRTILASFAVASVTLGALIPTIDLNDDWVKYFDEDVTFRSDAEFAIEHLSGLYPIEFSIEADGPGGISEPEYLERLEAFTAWLRSQPEVRHVYSYSDIIKRLNKNMHGDDPAWYRIPESRDLSAQDLLLYELSLPFGLDLNDRINIDKSATRVTATLDQIRTSEVRDFLSRSTEWLAVNGPSDAPPQPTGAAAMFAFISQRNIEGMLGGNLLAVLLIAGIIGLTIGNWRLGFLSLLPNLVPIFMTFGVWALFVGEVGMAAATVSATSLGIIVDSTIHFLTKYLRARKERALSPADAIRHTYQTVGKAIAVNSLILVFGFGVLAASTFLINSQMGLLTAIAIFIALAVDFLFLPALLLTRSKQKEAGMTSTGRQPRNRAATAATILLVLTAGLVSVPLEARQDDRGYEIAARSDRSDRGFGDSEVDLEMILTNAGGDESRRTLSIRTLEVPDENVGDLSLIEFDSPRDIRGTALLSHARILEPDDQWLYLPALKRVKRISSVNKSGPFVGSEFAFEDLTSQELNKYDYTYLREEECGPLVCDVVQGVPRYEHSGYTREVAWIDQEVFQVRRIDFYDRKGDLLKTLTADEYRLYDGEYWRPLRMSMANHQTGKRTDLIYSEFRFGQGLSETDFATSALERSR